ncbi:MAG: hypothetical protein JO301_06100 [Chitinophagaceae bacterium]|nr:hypothetical protein [Chitinophagaceae bacterium]
MQSLTQEQVIMIVARQFDDPGVTIDADSSMDNVADWDSLVHLGILVSLDVELEGRAAAVKKLAACRSVKEIVSCLAEHQLLTQ